MARNVYTDLNFINAGITGVTNLAILANVDELAVSIVGFDVTQSTNILDISDGDSDPILVIGPQQATTHFFSGQTLRFDHGADSTRIAIRRHSSGTATMQEWQNNAGSPLASVSYAGKIFGEGLDANDQQVTNVGAGLLLDDGVNVDQLNTTLSGALPTWDYGLSAEEQTGATITSLSSLIFYGPTSVENAAIIASRDMKLTDISINIQFDTNVINDEDILLEWEVRKSTNCETSFAIIADHELTLSGTTVHQCFDVALSPNVTLDKGDLWKITGRVSGGSIADFYMRMQVLAELL